MIALLETGQEKRLVVSRKGMSSGCRGYCNCLSNDSEEKASMGVRRAVLTSFGTPLVVTVAQVPNTEGLFVRMNGLNHARARRGMEAGVWTARCSGLVYRRDALNKGEKLISFLGDKKLALNTCSSAHVKVA